MKRKTKIETRYQNQRYLLKGAIGYLEWLMRKETNDGILTTSFERAEIDRFVARVRRESRFRS